MEDYSKYSKEELISFLEEIDQPIKSLDNVVIHLCESISCENCPIKLLNCNYRTKFEKTCLYSTCQEQLWNWLVSESRSKQLNIPGEGMYIGQFVKYKGYIGSIEYTAETNRHYGKVLGIKDLVNYQGSNIIELHEQFHCAVDDYIEICNEVKND